MNFKSCRGYARVMQDGVLGSIFTSCAPCVAAFMEWRGDLGRSGSLISSPYLVRLQAPLPEREKWGIQIRVPKVYLDKWLFTQGPQFRFSRRKKKRITKKFRKNRDNFRVIPDPNFYEIGKGTFVCHPALHSNLAAYLREKGYMYYHGLGVTS